jgi:hypothetical protein
MRGAPKSMVNIYRLIKSLALVRSGFISGDGSRIMLGSACFPPASAEALSQNVRF